MHNNTKIVTCKIEHICKKCGKKIQINEKAYRTNTKFIEPFYRCLNCKPTKEEITNMIQEEMREYHQDDELNILANIEEF